MDSNAITNELARRVGKKVSQIYVIGKDELDSIELSSYPIAIVVNTDPSYKAGQHWCAFYVKRRNVAYFFDSYANPYKSYGFDPSFKITKSNKKVLQPDESSTCGVWAIAFLVNMAKGKSLKYFEAQFTNNLNQNDCKLLRKYPIIQEYSNSKCLKCVARCCTNF